MKLSYKIYGAMAVVLVVMSIISGVSIRSMNSIGVMLVEIAEEDIPVTNA